MKKILKKIYKVIISELDRYYNEKRILFPMTPDMKLSVLSGNYEKIARMILEQYGISSLQLEENLFVIDEDMTPIMVSDHQHIVELFNENAVQPIALVRYWPTIPPHFNKKDFEIAEKLDIKALVSVSKYRSSIHLLMLKGDWDRCKKIRDDISRKLLLLSDEIGISINPAKEGSNTIDEFNFRGLKFRIYPHLSDIKHWREGLKTLNKKYLEATELPQYLILRRFL